MENANLKGRILIISSDINFGYVLKTYLELNDMQVDIVINGDDALTAMSAHTYNLEILDVDLHGVDGFTVVSEFRKFDRKTPLIFLTSRSMKADVIRGFSVGADDYITKPFDSDVLLLKIKAMVNRNLYLESGYAASYRIGKFDFYVKKRTLMLGTQSFHLTPRESDLLEELYLNRNSVLERNEALRKIWGDDNYFNARSMDVYVTRLRKYLKNDPKVKINNVHGSGFILVF